MSWESKKTQEAEDKMDSALQGLGVSAGLTTGQSEELAETIKAWVRALVDEEKSDLRDEINKSGMWDPDY